MTASASIIQCSRIFFQHVGSKQANGTVDLRKSNYPGTPALADLSLPEPDPKRSKLGKKFQPQTIRLSRVTCHLFVLGSMQGKWNISTARAVCCWQKKLGAESLGRIKAHFLVLLLACCEYLGVGLRACL